MHEVIITGVVQGVGFRPYIYKQCTLHGLKGYVQNIGAGVKIIIDDYPVLKKILKTLPALAQIDTVTVTPYLGSEKFDRFEIRESRGEGFAEIPPDLFLCRECKRELHQPHNRRYRYFFNTCTNCGPRYSITHHSPYDRDTTSMEPFPMCPECTQEYLNPCGRRYHAQTIACPKCGPKLELVKKTKGYRQILAKNRTAISQAAKLIAAGEIIAIKGIGGFHLVCNLDPATIDKLRVSTGRAHKPYAVMCRDIKMVSRLAHISKEEKKILLSQPRPIVALKKRMPLKEVSELNTVGIMLPYTALHYLLFDYLDQPLIMTSANKSGEPITTEEREQWVAYSLTQDRTIVNAIDDSVIKVIKGQRIFLRRSRGFVPQSFNLGKSPQNSLLAMGAEMNSVFAMVKESKIYLSPYLGDTKDWPSFKRYQETIDNFLRFTQTTPEIILSDLHPSYNTTSYAQTLADSWQIPQIKIQHHKAHAYSTALEYRSDDFIAVVADGAGYGEDGNIWGGEIFNNQERIGHLEYQPQIGGDSAVKYPVKMLIGILSKCTDPTTLQLLLGDRLPGQEYQLLLDQLKSQVNTPITSSCGRVLDAASYLLDICREGSYDGRPAILLDETATSPYKLEPVIEDNILLTTPLFQYLANHLSKDRGRLAATVLNYLAQGMYELAKQYNKPILFSGGCASSRYMTTFMLKQGVKINTQVPTGDGGISFGQIGYYTSCHRHSLS